MSKFTKTLVVALLLTVAPMRHYAQQPQFSNSQPTISVDITNIDLFDERVFFLYNLANDTRFDVVTSEQDGVFVVSANEAFEGIDLRDAFVDFREQNAQQFPRWTRNKQHKWPANTKRLFR